MYLDLKLQVLMLVIIGKGSAIEKLFINIVLMKKSHVLALRLRAGSAELNNTSGNVFLIFFNFF